MTIFSYPTVLPPCAFTPQLTVLKVLDILYSSQKHRQHFTSLPIVLLILILLVGCLSTKVSSEQPVTASHPPPSSQPSAHPVITQPRDSTITATLLEPISTPLSWPFRFLPGVGRYDIQQNAVIELVDSLHNQVLQLELLGRYTLAGIVREGQLQIAGSVDSFTIKRIGFNPNFPTESILRTGFLATISSSGEIHTFNTGTTNYCDPHSIAANLGRKLSLEVPPIISSTVIWYDTVSTVECYAGIPVSIVTYIKYIPGNSDERLSRTTIPIHQSHTLSMQGTTMYRGHTVIIVGKGHGTAQLYLDLIQGSIITQTSQSEATLTVTIDSLPSNFRQRVHESITRLP